MLDSASLKCSPLVILALRMHCRVRFLACTLGHAPSTQDSAVPPSGPHAHCALSMRHEPSDHPAVIPYIEGPMIQRPRGGPTRAPADTRAKRSVDGRSWRPGGKEILGHGWNAVYHIEQLIPQKPVRIILVERASEERRVIMCVLIHYVLPPWVIGYPNLVSPYSNLY